MPVGRRTGAVNCLPGRAIAKTGDEHVKTEDGERLMMWKQFLGCLPARCVDGKGEGILCPVNSHALTTTESRV